MSYERRKIRVLVVGACGRMGSAVAELVTAQEDMELAGGIEAPGHPRLGQPLGSGTITSDLHDALDSIDVIVDFATPAASLEHLALAASQGKPYVLGTTGFWESQWQEVRRLSSRLPLVYAPNFSVGINVLYELVREVAGLLGPGYDIEILEIHHRRKKDVPSGTARELARIALEAGNRSRLVLGRQGQLGEKSPDEIGVVAVRSGDVVGEHTVIFGTDGERLELVHKASSRLAFALGVVRAIRFIIGRPCGMYDMKAVLSR